MRAVCELQHPDFTRISVRLVYRNHAADGFSDEVLVCFHGVLQLAEFLLSLLKPMGFSKPERVNILQNVDQNPSYTPAGPSLFCGGDHTFF